MDSELLRRACERAEMDVTVLPKGWYISLHAGVILTPTNSKDREWIESRCADILVGMVRGLDSYDVERQPIDDEGAWGWSCTIWHGMGKGSTNAMATPDEGRVVAIITAALAVLEAGDGR